MYCGEHVAVKRENDGLLAVTLRCKSWTCNDCQDGRKRQLVAEGIGGKPNTFLTLTSRRKAGKTANQAALELSHAWRLLRLRIMRKYKIKKLPFLAVIEPHKSGWPHLHIMARSRYIPWKWLSAQMADLLDSPHVHIKRIHDVGGVAAYCAAYCTKCITKFGTAKRYWQSRDYDLRDAPSPRPVGKPGEGWEVWQMDLKRWIEMQIELGFCVVSQSSHTVFAHIDTS